MKKARPKKKGRIFSNYDKDCDCFEGIKMNLKRRFERILRRQ